MMRSADPRTVLTQMGALAFVNVQAKPDGLIRTMRFRRGEVLAYDKHHLLAITYRTGSRASAIVDAKHMERAQADIDEARRRYRWSHFGARGTAKLSEMECADPSARFSVLGELLSVGYRTTKAGDPPNTTYEHSFESKLPVLAEDRLGRLLILGGSYRITWRGIVG